MYKAIILIALAFASANAGRFLQSVNATLTNTTCSLSATKESCLSSGYCCASVSINGLAPKSPTLGVCVPAEFHKVAFNGVNNI